MYILVIPMDRGVMIPAGDAVRLLNAILERMDYRFQVPIILHFETMSINLASRSLDTIYRCKQMFLINWNSHHKH